MSKTRRLSGPKLVGVSIILVSMILASIVWSYTFELRKADSVECQAACGTALGNVCPHTGWLPIQSYLGFTSIIVLIVLGMILFFRGLGGESQTEKEKKMKEVLSKLVSEEKLIFSFLVKSKGAAFQGDIVNETGFSKVKVSRTLDKMEARGLIEKRRRGLANMVVVK